MKFSSLSLAAALLSSSPAAFGAGPSVNVCPGNGEEFEYYYQYCVDGNNIGEVEGKCHGDGTKEEDHYSTTPCSDWAIAGGATPVCVMCGDKAVCASANASLQEVCAAAQAKTCHSQGIGGLNYEVDRFPCHNNNGFTHSYDTCVNGVFESGLVTSDSCSSFSSPSTPYCLECGGIGVCASVDGSCERVLGSGASFSKNGSGGVMAHSQSLAMAGLLAGISVAFVGL